jgi:hypothetical protein
MLDIYQLDGFKIVSSDGTFLGIISQNVVDSNSITNIVGKYGSIVSSTSIFNIVGEYGSIVSSKSPFNIVADNPPQILDKNGNFFAYLTKNIVKTPRVDPDELKAALKIS